jgi:hypothetical protein
VSDTIRHDVPAATTELAYLNTVKLGDVRKGILFPAFDVEMEWACVGIDPGKTDPSWEFEGRFCGQLLCVIVITVPVLSGDLKLSVKETK